MAELKLPKDLPPEVMEMLNNYKNPPNKLRTLQEVTARYNLTLENYKKICFSSGNVRDMKIATHAEIKILGWVLGKPDKDVVNDIAKNSNTQVFPGQVTE
ncbi:MAG: hypothetical protein K6G55_03920 [Selenomonadaceae bacterium]|nr:hypothetical protein [Selenomonadaceae bacterium]